MLWAFLAPLESRSVQKTIKIELESNIWENLCVSVLVPFLVASWTCYGPPLRANEMLWRRKGQGFLAPEALESQELFRSVSNPNQQASQSANQLIN